MMVIAFRDQITLNFVVNDGVNCAVGDATQGSVSFVQAAAAPASSLIRERKQTKMPQAREKAMRSPTLVVIRSVEQ